MNSDRIETRGLTLCEGVVSNQPAGPSSLEDASKEVKRWEKGAEYPLDIEQSVLAKQYQSRSVRACFELMAAGIFGRCCDSDNNIDSNSAVTQQKNSIHQTS